MTRRVQLKTLATLDMAIRVVVAACALVATSCEQSTVTAPSTAPANFNLEGTVRDTTLRPVAGARVEIFGGPHASQSTTTDANGRFVFAGLTPSADSVQLIVTKEGFSAVTTTARSNTPAVITLTATNLIQLEGSYQVSFTAANACDAIPVRRRTYTATISRPTNTTLPSGTAIAIRLGGADFYFGYDTFSGLLGDDAVRLMVFSRDAFNKWLEDQPIFERLDSTSYLSVMGTATATGARAGTSFTAVMDGTIAYCSSAKAPTTADFPPTCSVPIVECQSNRHEIMVTPQ
jgi:hypothetical protein